MEERRLNAGFDCVWNELCSATEQSRAELAIRNGECRRLKTARKETEEEGCAEGLREGDSILAQQREMWKFCAGFSDYFLLYPTHLVTN